MECKICLVENGDDDGRANGIRPARRGLPDRQLSKEQRQVSAVPRFHFRGTPRKLFGSPEKTQSPGEDPLQENLRGERQIFLQLFLWAAQRCYQSWGFEAAWEVCHLRSGAMRPTRLCLSANFPGSLKTARLITTLRRLKKK